MGIATPFHKIFLGRVVAVLCRFVDIWKTGKMVEVSTTLLLVGRLLVGNLAGSRGADGCRWGSKPCKILQNLSTTLSTGQALPVDSLQRGRAWRKEGVGGRADRAEP